MIDLKRPVGGIAVLFAATMFSGVAAGKTIPEIQGIGHISSLAGQDVTTDGVVTAVGGNGFYMQDPEGDGDERTADGLFVFTGGEPAVTVGDLINIAGPVSEFIPGGADSGNLSTTQISNATIEIISSGNPLPSPMVIGKSGRVPPAVEVISDDEIDPPINLQDAVDDAANNFDPDEDGIDFYESLEGMLVTIEDPVAVSATRSFGSTGSELFTVPNNGRTVQPKRAITSRGALLLQPDPDNQGDQNPERVQIQFDGDLFPFDAPAITVGDRLANVTGVMGYSFGNFEVNATQTFDVNERGLRAERTRLRGNRRFLTLASYNVLNLSADASDVNQMVTLGGHIADNLGSPDIIALQEIQDNNGETDDGVTDATETLAALRDAVVLAGGPTYGFSDVAPADNTSGGAPGGNIRNAFFYNPDRVDLVEVISLTPDVLADLGVSNPTAFDGARNPLVGVFSFDGDTITVVNNHITSRFGSTPVFGGPQPFVQAGETEREAQFGALNEAASERLAKDASARIVVLGDLNTFQFTDDLTEILPGDDEILTNLIPPVGTRRGIDRGNIYTFNFEGNSQVLDNLFVSQALRRHALLDIVHVNVDFPRIDDNVGSDHEPLVARLFMGRRP